MKTAPPDESVFDIPASWRRRLLHPRRGGFEVPLTEPDLSCAETVRAVRDRSGAWIEQILTHPESDPELVRHARRRLAGEADPLGAAVVALALIWRRGDSWSGHDEFRDRHERQMDALIGEHGLPFAASAFVELDGIKLDHPVQSTPEDRERPPSIVRIRVREQWGPHVWFGHTMFRRLRGLLARASDQDYAAAERSLAGLRRTPEERVAVTYLLPTRRDWADECCADPPADHNVMWQLLCSLTSLDQIARLRARAEVQWQLRAPDVLVTMADGVGPAIAPVVAAALEADLHAASRRDLLNLLGVLPTDEAFGMLLAGLDQKYVEPATTATMKRFPVRALRMLAERVDGDRKAGKTTKAAKIAEELLRSHVTKRPEIVAAALPDLPPGGRSAVERISGSAARAPEAPPEALPRVLAEPPWTRRRARKPVVIDGLAAPDPAMNWLPGEREEWADPGHGHWWHPRADADWAHVVAEHRAGRRHLDVGDFALGPEEPLRPLLPGWTPQGWARYGGMRTVVGRFELDALPATLRIADQKPVSGPDPLLPFLAEEVALLMADRLARLKSFRPYALEWFARHRVAAAPMLVPAALGEPGRERRAAEAALLHLAAREGAGAIVEVAGSYGPAAAGAIEALLAIDPLDLVPDRIPKVGGWADPALLPQVVLREGGGALPDAAVGHLITMLAISRPEEWYAGIDAVAEACDPGSLAAFSWALYERWAAAGSPNRDGWALAQLGRLGDDEAVRRLAPLIRAWPGESAHKKAAAGLEVLAGIGTDVALMHLHGIAQKVKFKTLRARAQEKIDEVAAGLGLSPEELADRLVPDFGLDAAGSMVLDYGPRRFTVGFDERLKPYVNDQDGRRRASLPKPGARDDADVAAASYKRFAALRKDVRAAAADQVLRLELAMVRRRRWPAGDFRRLFAGHPLIGHLARRLVWLGEPGTAFRIAEDGTLADIHDEICRLPDGALVGIAHPLQLGDDLPGWAEVFADYEIVQPFRQLARGVHALTAEERRTGNLARFEGIVVPTGRILGLERRGWERESPQDAGIQSHTARPLPGGGEVAISFDPAIAVGHPWDHPELTLAGVWFTPGTDLDPVDACEMLADLVEVAGHEPVP